MYNNHSHYQIRIENKVGKKLHQLLTGCVTNWCNFYQLNFLFVFDNILIKKFQKNCRLSK